MEVMQLLVLMAILRRNEIKVKKQRKMEMRELLRKMKTKQVKKNFLNNSYSSNQWVI